MDNRYWIEGKVNIPEERREEFNENVRKLFRLCGIRKLEEIEIAGKLCTVVHEPEPDGQGIISFDYSVFERQKRKISTYDMNTCELHVEGIKRPGSWKNRRFLLFFVIEILLFLTIYQE